MEDKTKMKRFFKKLSEKMLTIVILTLTALGSVWVYAAFLEPSLTPADSTQDFTANIMGDNSVNNTFDSSSVVGNVDGSLIERLEYIIEYLGG